MTALALTLAIILLVIVSTAFVLCLFLLNYYKRRIEDLEKPKAAPQQEEEEVKFDEFILD